MVVSGTGVADPNNNHQSRSEKRRHRGNFGWRSQFERRRDVFFLDGAVRATGSVH